MESEAIELANPVEADTSTVNEAANKILSLMDGTPSEDATQPEEVTEPVSEEPVLEEAQEEPSEEPEQTDVVTHFSDLAEHLGVEESYLESLIVPTKVNGEEKSATIKDLLATFQKGESADLKLMELADQRKQLDNERTQYNEALQQEWSRIQALDTELQSMLMGDDDVTLNEIRHSDPAEYAARMAERQLKTQRAAKIQQELQQTQSGKVLTEYSHRVQSEQAKLLTALPEWADEKVRESENVRVRSYLKGQGLQDHEIDGKIENGQLVHPGIIDHRAIVMARKAMLFDEARKGTEPKKTRLKSLPKVGAGKPKGKANVDEKARSEVRGQLRRSGSVKDAAQAIKQLMEN